MTFLLDDSFQCHLQDLHRMRVWFNFATLNVTYKRPITSTIRIFYTSSSTSSQLAE